MYKWEESSDTLADCYTWSRTDICSTLKSCSNCLSTSDSCAWCDGSCKSSSECELPTAGATSDVNYCNVTDGVDVCAQYYNCEMCHNAPLSYNCEWATSRAPNRCRRSRQKGRTEPEDPNATVAPMRMEEPTCPAENVCELQTNCSTCVRADGGKCMWCQNVAQCVPVTTYIYQYPYGQCMEWRNDGHCESFDCSSYRCVPLSISLILHINIRQPRAVFTIYLSAVFYWFATCLPDRVVFQDLQYLSRQRSMRMV